MLNSIILQQIIDDTAALTGVTGQESASFQRKYLEPIDVIDSDGNQVGTAPRGLAHRLGLWHVVVYCLISNSQGDRFLVQVRQEQRLDISVGGHVSAGETDYS